MAKFLNEEKFQPDVKVPLEGIKVLDLFASVRNMVTHVLADFGAEVKVEKPGSGILETD